MNQSAITMLQKTIEFMNKDICTELMPEMIPSLLTVSRILLKSIFVFSIQRDSNENLCHYTSNQIWDFHSHIFVAGEGVSRMTDANDQISWVLSQKKTNFLLSNIFPFPLTDVYLFLLFRSFDLIAWKMLFIHHEILCQSISSRFYFLF